jgi:hypothetical protein
MAIWNPLPRSLNCSNVCRRFLESVGNELKVVQAVTESFPVASSNTTTQLMEIAQSKMVCIIYNNGVYVGYINAAFNDIGTN